VKLVGSAAVMAIHWSPWPTYRRRRSSCPAGRVRLTVPTVMSCWAQTPRLFHGLSASLPKAIWVQLTPPAVQS
jgi:hypothetical protein